VDISKNAHFGEIIAKTLENHMQAIEWYFAVAMTSSDWSVFPDKMSKTVQNRAMVTIER